MSGMLRERRRRRKKDTYTKIWRIEFVLSSLFSVLLIIITHTTVYLQDNMAVVQLHDIYYYYQQEANPTANESPLEKLKINGQSAIILTTLKPLVGHFIAPVQSVLCKAIIHARKGLCEREREKERPDIYLNRI